MKRGRPRLGSLWRFKRAPDRHPEPEAAAVEAVAVEPAVAAVEAAIGEVRASGLFDPAWYLAQNPDVAAAGMDPLRHYVVAGAAEGRRGSPHLDPLWYFGENPDAAKPGVDPLLHYIRVGRALGHTPTALDPGQAFDSFLSATRAGALPFAGSQRESVSHVHYTLRPNPLSDVLAMPPLALARRIGAMTLADFDEVGRRTKSAIVRCLPPDFAFRGARVLDFGCGIGRVIRHFGEEARDAEIWGADIDGTSIRWAVENLTPPFRFYRMSSAPSLPFEDSSFDLIYAVGVFSQVYEDWHHWAVELRRVLKPGGTFFTSYAGPATFENLMEEPYEDLTADFGLYVRNPFQSWNLGGPMVFMSLAWIERYWGSLFDVDFVAPNALNDDLSICVMHKPAPGRPPRLGLRVVETATRQAFSRDGVGRIHEDHDGARPLPESFGVEASGAATISGWIALRGDTPALLEVSIDGTAIPSDTEFSPGDPYRDWPDTLSVVFQTRIDLGASPRVRGRLAVDITGRGGTRHEMSIPILVR